MRQALDGVGVPKAAFVQYRRRCRAETMASHFVLFKAETAKGGVDCVFAHRDAMRPAHFHFFGWERPNALLKVEVGPFRRTKLAGAHKSQS
jgi:hypothetical protein